MQKISIVGAGNVGSALAERVLAGNLADIVLVDIAEGLAKGKACDLSDASSLTGYRKKITGTTSFEAIKASGIVVITAGFPRRPGMTREDLVAKNGGIIKTVIKAVKNFAPGAIIVVVTNPLDIMTRLAYKEAGCDRSRIIGMAGNLDGARFASLLSEKLGAPLDKIETYVMGSHGDTMVPVISRTRVDGKLLQELLKQNEIDELVEKVKKRGGEIVRLLKTGSAYFSPSASCLEILKALVRDEKKVIACSCILDGEYGLKDMALGVPARIGGKGIEEIMEWDLSDQELTALKKSAEAINAGS